MTQKGRSLRVISATLDSAFLKTVNDFCYEHNLARSAVIEYALELLFDGKNEKSLATLAKQIVKGGGDRVSRRHRYD